MPAQIWVHFICLCALYSIKYSILDTLSGKLWVLTVFTASVVEVVITILAVAPRTTSVPMAYLASDIICGQTCDCFFIQLLVIFVEQGMHMWEKSMLSTSSWCQGAKSAVCQPAVPLQLFCFPVHLRSFAASSSFHRILATPFTPLYPMIVCVYKYKYMLYCVVLVFASLNKTHKELRWINVSKLPWPLTAG